MTGALVFSSAAPAPEAQAQNVLQQLGITKPGQPGQPDQLNPAFVIGMGIVAIAGIGLIITVLKQATGSSGSSVGSTATTTSSSRAPLPVPPPEVSVIDPPEETATPAPAPVTTRPTAALKPTPTPRPTPTTTLSPGDRKVSVEQGEILAAAALSEMMNKYRADVGNIHPLYVAPTFNDMAAAWSQEMARTGVHAHSDVRTRTHSIENIQRFSLSLAGVKHRPDQLTTADWGKVADFAFDQWYMSEVHNATMLNASFSGTGVGFELDAKGNVWVTAMFYSGNKIAPNRFADKATRQLWATGGDRTAYVPNGTILPKVALGSWAPYPSTRGVNPTYSDGDTKQSMDPRNYYPLGRDPRLKGF